MLRQVPKPQLQVPAKFELTATPYNGAVVSQEKLKLFHGWLAGQFTPEEFYPDYMVAEKLDVHRVISDTWLMALYHFGRLIISMTKKIGNSDDGPSVSMFAVTPADFVVASCDASSLRSYDPWTDRSLDRELQADHPDEYIDKYFELFTNEAYVYTHKPRIRPNGTYFTPMDRGDHPRFSVEGISAIRANKGLPPREWRELIDTLASGDKAGKRR
jgi:hypothetical protein